MKKMFVAFGIAIALICGAIFGASMATANASSVEPETVFIKEAIAMERTDHWYYGDAEVDPDTVEVIEIVSDPEYGGGYYVACFWDDPYSGEQLYTHIAVSELGEFEF